jgi:hypothetical protein
MASIARRGWHRVKSSLADEVAARALERDVELFRQLSDVFKELAVIRRCVEELRAQIEAQAELGLQNDVESQSIEILGRLVRSARARLDVLEGAAQNSA